MDLGDAGRNAPRPRNPPRGIAEFTFYLGLGVLLTSVWLLGTTDAPLRNEMGGHATWPVYDFTGPLLLLGIGLGGCVVMMLAVWLVNSRRTSGTACRTIGWRALVFGALSWIFAALAIVRASQRV